MLSLLLDDETKKENEVNQEECSRKPTAISLVQGVARVPWVGLDDDGGDDGKLEHSCHEIRPTTKRGGQQYINIPALR